MSDDFDEEALRRQVNCCWEGGTVAAEALTMLKVREAAWHAHTERLSGDAGIEAAELVT